MGYPVEESAAELRALHPNVKTSLARSSRHILGAGPESGALHGPRLVDTSRDAAGSPWLCRMLRQLLFSGRHSFVAGTGHSLVVGSHQGDYLCRLAC